MWEWKWVYLTLGRRVDPCSLHEAGAGAGCLVYLVNGDWKHSRNVLLPRVQEEKGTSLLKNGNWLVLHRSVAPGILLPESKHLKLQNIRPGPRCANWEEWAKAAAKVPTVERLVRGKHSHAEWAIREKWQRTWWNPLWGIFHRLSKQKNS